MTSLPKPKKFFYRFTLFLGALLLLLPLIAPFTPQFSEYLSTFELSLTGLAGLLLVFLGFVGQQKAQAQHQEAVRQQNQTLKKEIQTLKKQQAEETARFELALKSGRLALWEWKVKGNEAYFSDSWQDLIGFTDHDFPQDLHAWQDRIHPDDANEVQKALLKILSGKEKYYENIHRVRHRDGHYIWVYDRGQVFFNDVGNVDRFSAIRIDMTEQKKHDEQLQLDQTLLENTQDAIAIANENGTFIRTNPAFKHAFAIEGEEIETLTLPELLDNIQDEPPIDVMAKVKENGNWRGELTLSRHNGEVALANLVDIHRVKTASETFYTLVCSDITELKRSNQTLDKLAYQDNVTGLANRHQFYKWLPRFIEQAQHHGGRFTLMFLDLDDFKQVNDTLGHDVGDQLLRKVGDVLLANLSEGAKLARVGGDEFVVLCPVHTDTPTLETVGQRLNELLSQPFKLGDHTVKIGSSVGMAIYPDHGKTQSQLLKNADTAMYYAKQHGKGSTCIYQPGMSEKPKLETIAEPTTGTASCQQQATPSSETFQPLP